MLVLYLVPVLLLVLICGVCLIAIGGLATATRRATCWLARGQKLEIAGIGRSAAPGGNFEEA